MRTLHPLSVVAALALAGTVFAQAQSPADPSTPATKTESTATSSTGSTDATRVASSADKHAPAIVGTKVEMAGGENIGEVKEVLRDQKGEATYAIVSYGGIMGFGTKLTAVPWATVTAHMQDDRIVMARSHLESAPVLARGKPTDASSDQWSRDANSYWAALTPPPARNRS
jgi:hypothetical protein